MPDETKGNYNFHQDDLISCGAEVEINSRRQWEPPLSVGSSSGEPRRSAASPGQQLPAPRPGTEEPPSRQGPAGKARSLGSAWGTDEK